MRIITLRAENVKRLRAVEITPEGDVVVISGRNAQGKSSVLDAIWMALGGGAGAKETTHPIREGEKKASVTLDLGDLIVTRKWTLKGTTLEVSAREHEDGGITNTTGTVRYSSPQAVLDGLIGRLSFDPLAFANQGAKDQLATLLDVVDLPFDPAALDARRREVFEARTDVNRDVRTLEGQLAGISVPPGAPEEAVSVAESFAETVGIDGVVLTKLDGDARGGAALSVKEVTGKPILFAGVGEKLVDFEPFHPDRMAGRILGMGDVLTLIEKAEESFDQEAAEKAAGKLRKGNFTLDDFLEQMQQVKKMGPLQNIIGMLPGVPKELKNTQLDDKELGKVEAIIRSMTPEERNDITIINGSRRLRIAQGSGTTTQDVNALLKQFKMVQGMMKQMAGAGGKRGRFPGLPGLPGMPGN